LLALVLGLWQLFRVALLFLQRREMIEDERSLLSGRPRVEGLGRWSEKVDRFGVDV
jgi:hypothetical protein